VAEERGGIVSDVTGGGQDPFCDQQQDKSPKSGTDQSGPEFRHCSLWHRLNSWDKKKRLSSAEDERSWNTPEKPGAKMHNSSLRQPGYPLSHPPSLMLWRTSRRTRGFASPDFSGFALSEIFLVGFVRW
jgi:hypothetical protein